MRSKKRGAECCSVTLESHPTLMQWFHVIFFFFSRFQNNLQPFSSPWKMNGFEPFSTPPWHPVLVLVSQTNSSSHPSASSISCAVSYCSFCGGDYPAADFLWLRVTSVRSNCKMLQWGLTRSLKPQGSSVKLSSPVSNKVRNNFIEMKNFTVLQNLSWLKSGLDLKLRFCRE